MGLRFVDLTKERVGQTYLSAPQKVGFTMFTLDDLRELLNARPFVTFRLHLSDGGAIEVRHRELVTAGRRYAVVGLPDPADPDAPFDRHTVVWYMHVTRVETL